MFSPKTSFGWKRMFLIFAILTFFGIIFVRFYWFGNEGQSGEYTFYIRAINLASTDAGKAFDLCSKTDEMRDECFTEIARIVSIKDFKRGLNICKGITETGWRDECFFNIAISLVHNTSLAIEICEMSEMFKHDCYTRLGSITAHTLKNTSSAILACNEVPIESRSSCFLGLGSFFGDYFNENISSSVLACNDVPVEFKDDCFFGLSNSFRRFGSNVSSIMLACNKIPIEFRNYCSQDAGSSFSQLFGYDINSAVSACNEFPAELRSACLRSLSFDKGRIGDVSLCNKFEKPYNDICFLGFGKKEGVTFSEGKIIKCDSVANETFRSWCYRGFGRGLGERFSDNVSLAFNICNSFLDEGYKFDCYRGVSEGVGNLFLETDYFSVLGRCSKLGEFSSYCFERVGRKIVGLYSYNLSKAFDICYKLNESFRPSCFTGIGKGLGEQFLYNPSLASMKCNELLEPFNTYCDHGVNGVVILVNDVFSLRIFL